MRSTPQVYRGPRVLALRETDGEKRLFQVALAPEESGPFLILLLPGPGNPRAVAIEDGLEDFPAGTIRFSNLTAEEFDISAAQVQATLAAGETSLFSLPKGKPTCLVSIRKSSGGDIVFSNNWSVAQNSRTLVLLLPSMLEANPNPTVIRLAEVLPKP